MIRLSIVTPTLNSAKYLPDCLESARDATPEGIKLEHIVADGGSEDGTQSIAAAHPHVRLLEHIVGGPANAQNAGLTAATGDYVMFLMSDDMVVPGAFDSFARLALVRPQVEMWSGGIVFFEEDLHRGRRELNRRIPNMDGSIHLKAVLYGSPMLPSRIFKRALFEYVSPFDERYQYSNDRELLARMYFHRVSGGVLANDICFFRVHGKSRTAGGNLDNTLTYLREHLRWGARMLSLGGRESARDAMTLAGWEVYECMRYARYRLKALFA